MAKIAGAMRSKRPDAKEWCIENGVNLYTFRDRLSRLRRLDERGEAGEPLFAAENSRKKPKISEPVQTWAQVEQSEPIIETAAPIVVEIGTARILVDPGFDAETFERVCRALAAL
jgi:hypothetical protein